VIETVGVAMVAVLSGSHGEYLGRNIAIGRIGHTFSSHQNSRPNASGKQRKFVKIEGFCSEKRDQPDEPSSFSIRFQLLLAALLVGPTLPMHAPDPAHCDVHAWFRQCPQLGPGVAAGDYAWASKSRSAFRCASLDLSSALMGAVSMKARAKPGPPLKRSRGRRQ
jgi:hypothetical protein